MKTASDLQQLLRLIDRRSYPAYKDTKGQYDFGSYILSIDHVQGDPFAAPSKISIHIDGKKAGFPESCRQTSERLLAVEDHLLRLFGKAVEKYQFKAKGSGKSGLLAVSRPGQKVLKRTACSLNMADGGLVLRLEAGFPANGRTICSMELQKILFDFLPECVGKTLYYQKLNQKQLEDVLFLADDRAFIRQELVRRNLIAFIANGSMLPRESGISDRPMREGKAFCSPRELEVELDLPHKKRVKGMGVPEGIMLIVGGGYHGKSTLLKALEAGVYDHIGGDGREFVISRSDGVKIRAEDGRSVIKDNISLFVRDLPGGKDTTAFYTEDASGSTSQAANVIEAIEGGSKFLLIDEDTCATNFMIRDELMQRVVHRSKEPIIPFIERARFLYESCGISSVIVAGSSGAYFKIADSIIQMDHYEPKEITAFAKEEAKVFSDVMLPGDQPVLPEFNRVVQRTVSGRERDRIKVKSLGKLGVMLNKETIDLQFVEQIVDAEQTAALGYLLAYAVENIFDGKASMAEVVDRLFAVIEKKGIEGILPGSHAVPGLALPRRQEIFACFNRCRSLRI